MEHTSELVYEGNLINEYSYPQRSEKFQEIEIGVNRIPVPSERSAFNRTFKELKRGQVLFTRAG